MFNPSVLKIVEPNSFAFDDSHFLLYLGNNDLHNVLILVK